jgi:hypothetical protein
MRISFHFQPINCNSCQKLIWRGLSSGGFSIALDTAALTIEEEIVKRISKLMTYEIHKTSVSFEATARVTPAILISDPKKVRIVLATHTCSKSIHLFETLPEYWERKPELVTTAEGVRF